MNTWIVIGLAGQAIFGGRFLVQWLASEIRGESVIPVMFWFLSLFGAAVLLIYAVHRQDPVFIVGEVGGIGIYIRNLVLIRRKRRAQARAGLAV